LIFGNHCYCYGDKELVTNNVILNELILVGDLDHYGHEKYWFNKFDKSSGDILIDNQAMMS